MALPPEIRVRIFELVCGSKMVHIGLFPADYRTWKFRRVGIVCRASQSENEVYANLMGLGITDESQRFKNDHPTCQLNREPAFDFGLLGVSRTIYRETRFLAVQTTTFSFAERWDIEDQGDCIIQEFVTNMPQEQLKHVRKVRLDMTMLDAASEAKWKQTINFVRASEALLIVILCQRDSSVFINRILGVPHFLRFLYWRLLSLITITSSTSIRQTVLVKNIASS